MSWILSWQEFLKIDAVREATANGFRIHDPWAGKTTSDKGKKAAAAANSAFHQWWGCLRVWGKWGLEGFSQLSSSLLWSWRALWCYTEGDTCHISVACISLKIKLQISVLRVGCEYWQGCGNHRIPLGSETSLEMLGFFPLFRKFTAEIKTPKILTIWERKYMALSVSNLPSQQVPTVGH